MDTKQQIQPSTENVKSCYKRSIVTETESQTTAWYDTGTQSQMVATHNHINCISNSSQVWPYQMNIQQWPHTGNRTVEIRYFPYVPDT